VHSDKPFTVVGVLRRTGTPVDRSIHVSLEAMEAIHLDWQGGMRIPGLSIPPQFAKKFDLAPKEITAALIGLKSRARAFQVQREINNYAGEALLAVLPGVALNELWSIVGVVENTLLLVAGMIVVIGLSGMIVAVWAGLNERRRELAILRSVGASPVDVIVLLALEGLLLTALGVTLGYALLTVLSLAAAPWMQARFGVVLPAWPGGRDELALVGMVFAAGLLAALLPALRACRLSLADGLTPRL
jgi:putative ABC transport system permease protein